MGYTTSDDKAEPGTDPGTDPGTGAKGDSAEPKRDAPGEGRSHYDREHHDGDVF